MATINIDSIIKTGSLSYGISNGDTLFVDQDSRYGTNQDLSTVLSYINITNGIFEVNATKVRLIPFESGSGNVPGYDTIISQGSASGKLLTVYSSTFGIPVTTGSAMPSSGFIKIRQWNSINFTTGSLSGITASSTGQDTVGWLEIVGRYGGFGTANSFAVSRLGEAKFLGDWYYVGTTSGNRATTYEIPGNGSRTFLAGVWVETTSSSDVYEFYPYAQDKLATSSAIPTDYLRGKVCWISTASILRFGHDGTNSNGGYLPPSGSRIRIPNIFLYDAIIGGEATNAIPTSTITNRYQFVTTNAGNITFDKVSCSGWYCKFQQPYSINISSSAVMSYIGISECPTHVKLNDIGLSMVKTNTPTFFGVKLDQCQVGGTIQNCVSAINNQNQSLALTDCENFTLKNNKIIALGSKNINDGVLEGTRLNNSIFSGNTIGVGELKLTTCKNIKVYSSTYYAIAVGRAPVVLSNSPAFSLYNSCEDILFDQISYGGLYSISPSSFLRLGASGHKNITLRNIGSANNPLAISTTDKVYDAPWSRVTTVATVTKTDHGLTSGDSIYVFISSNTTTITLSTKTVSVINSNSFTFTAVNSGYLTGTLSYTGVSTLGQNYLGDFDAASSVDNIRFQRIYTTRIPTSIFPANFNNSNKNVKIQSVFTDFAGGTSTPSKLSSRDSAWNKHGSIFDSTEQAAIYGSHFIDQYIAGSPQNTGSQSWTRSSTTITTSCSSHNLVTGDVISILSSSSTSAIRLGRYSITAADSNTFKFIGLNAGDLSGTLSFVPINATFWILMNENSTETANQITLSGSSVFNAAGSLLMYNVNDSFIYETPYFIRGYKNFPISQVFINGVAGISTHDISYSINKGSGYGSYKNLSYPRAGGGGSNGSTTVTMTDTTGVAVGDYVFGTNIGGNAKVVSIDSSTNITVDQVNIGTVSDVLYFNALPGESDIPSTGFKIKVKIVTNASNSTLLKNLYFNMRYDAVTRGYDYPLDETSVTLTNLKNPSEVRIFDAANPTVEITGQESVTGGTYTTTIDSTTYPLINIAILSLGYQNIRLTNIDISGGDINFPIQQQIDRQYLNP